MGGAAYFPGSDGLVVTIGPALGPGCPPGDFINSIAQSDVQEAWAGRRSANSCFGAKSVLYFLKILTGGAPPPKVDLS